MSSRVARRVDKLWGRCGTCFADRYHCRVITSPRQLRNLLRHQLVNFHEDALREEGRHSGGGFDPCASAARFDGWHPGVRHDVHARRARYERLPVHGA